jgi:DUF1680 family protein
MVPVVPRAARHDRGNRALEQREFGEITLGPDILRDRLALNFDYMESLRPENLLRPYLFEAGLWSWAGTSGTTTTGQTAPAGPGTWHWGWEAPTSQLRGHILGHWLPAAARLRHQRPRLGAAADLIVTELARCQQASGDGWVTPFPGKYLERIAAGRRVWVPQYVIHKVLAGLPDVSTIGGNSTYRRQQHRTGGSPQRGKLVPPLDRSFQPCTARRHPGLGNRRDA